MIALTGKMMDLKWLTFTGVFISIGGMFLMAAFSMLRQSQSRNRKARPHPQPEPLFHANTTNKLLPIGNNDLIPSVTEATTNLLKTPANKSSVQSD